VSRTGGSGDRTVGYYEVSSLDLGSERESRGEKPRISAKVIKSAVAQFSFTSIRVPKIFQPFFRVDDSRDNATGGVGLGLSIAYRAVGLHHGRLWAENAHPGLRVKMELPLA
jgi:hypothetical protein